MRNGRQRTRDAGVLGEVLRLARDVFDGTLIESLKESAKKLLRIRMMLVIGYSLAAAGLVFGAIMLLTGLLHALRLSPLPDAAAYSIVGVVAVMGGLVSLQLARRKR